MIAVHRRNLIEEWGSVSSKEASEASISTEGPDSPRQHECRRGQRNKEKLELCKKFTEYGYCPYDRKCKFAHGYHELRKNNTTNCKYKTKQCVTFVKEGFCQYGSRCNFVHTGEGEARGSAGPGEFREIFYWRKEESRVLSLLGHK